MKFALYSIFFLSLVFNVIMDFQLNSLDADSIISVSRVVSAGSIPQKLELEDYEEINESVLLGSRKYAVAPIQNGYMILVPPDASKKESAADIMVFLKERIRSLAVKSHKR